MLVNKFAENIGKALTRSRKVGSQDRKQICAKSEVSERTLAKIEAGDPTVSLSRYLSVANVLNMTWLFEIFEAPEPKKELRYLTGLSALNLPIKGRDLACWHSSHIANTRAWSVPGVNFSSTQWIIGLAGVYKANDSLKKAGLSFGLDVYAASYERALFDLLYEFLVVREKPVPNIQAKDIDDSINFDQVMKWIDQSELFIESDKLEKMKAWLRSSDYDFDGNSKAA